MNRANPFLNIGSEDSLVPSFFGQKTYFMKDVTVTSFFKKTSSEYSILSLLNLEQ